MTLFFDILGVHLLDSFNEGYHTGQLSVSQRRGVITLIPKDDSRLANLRPITLLNVDYKMLAKTIARRIANLTDNHSNWFHKGKIHWPKCLFTERHHGIHGYKQTPWNPVYRF